MPSSTQTLRTFVIIYGGLDVNPQIELDTILNDAKFNVYLQNAFGKNAYVYYGDYATQLASISHQKAIYIDLVITAAEDSVILADLPNLLASLQAAQPNISGVFSWSHAGYTYGY